MRFAIAKVSLITLILVAFSVSFACVPWGAPLSGPGSGGGMMGGGMGQGSGGGMMSEGTGQGGMEDMMRGMMGGGMMGGNNQAIEGPSNNIGAGPNSYKTRAISIDQAAEAVTRFLSSYGPGLRLAQVLEFDQNFYAVIEERGSGSHAMELPVDKYTGQVFPETGPNMMWNTKYGMSTSSRAPSISPEDAASIAGEFLSKSFPGSSPGDAYVFYGYYTLLTLQQGRIEGMLSVNAFSGQVWYHSWHGPFLGIKKYD